MDEEAEHFRRITMKVLLMQLNSIIVMDVVAYGGAAAGIIVTLKEYMLSLIHIYMIIFEKVSNALIADNGALNVGVTLSYGGHETDLASLYLNVGTED